MFKFQRLLRFLLASLVSVTPAFSQTRVSLSTNFVDYVDGGTLNVDASVNVSSNWSGRLLSIIPILLIPSSARFPWEGAIGRGMCIRDGGFREAPVIRNSVRATSISWREIG